MQRTGRARSQRDNSIRAAFGDGSPVHDGLKMLDWDDVSRILGLNAYERQTLHRLKAGRLTRWNVRSGDFSCPIDGCANDSSTMAQVFWDCSLAKRLWHSLAARWGGSACAALTALRVPSLHSNSRLLRTWRGHWFVAMGWHGAGSTTKRKTSCTT